MAIQEQVMRQGKTALVTGASSGFGLLTCVRLAEQGYTVYAGVRNMARTEELELAAKRAHVTDRIRLLLLDVTDGVQIKTAIHTIAAEAGKLDALVNNAGYAAGGFVEEIPISVWREQFETNVFAVVALTQSALPLLRKSSHGRIILLSSVSGKIGFPTLAPYAASKHALEGLGESLRLELAPFGISVSLVLPGPYRTNIWDKGTSLAAEPPADSVYGDYYSKIVPRILRSGERGGDPQRVARTIVQALSAGRPRLRYLPSWSERVTLAGKQLLPWRWIEAAALKSLGLRKDKSKK